ncbi:TPA: lysis protein [Yersinia enterocolitica]|nr:lysis protein [Yersinia enterocolitica]HDL8420896.1 lysis protein [Yersinia enterocolitica]HEN3302883.1 lysis protein [Yersinia enterocolitica]HEN3393343.1 lysis protein [Yersinia enterocolitica]
MTFDWRAMVWGLLLVFAIASAKLASYYHGQAIAADGRATAAETLVKQQQEIITDMQARQRDVAALDAKYTKELADAKASIDQLQSDVIAGRKRLQLNATCKRQFTSGSASLDDAASPGLTDSAQRDYFTLRERIETSGKMIAGLQDYIKTQCLR